MVKKIKSKAEGAEQNKKASEAEQEEVLNEEILGEPHVRLFGEDLSKEQKREAKAARKADRSQAKGEWQEYADKYQHHDGGGVIFGLLLMFTGVILLLNYLGLVSWQFWEVILYLWPVLLILIGIKMILGWNWAGRIVSFIVVLGILAVVVFYGLVQVNSPLAGYFPDNWVEFARSINNLNSLP